MSMQNSGGEDRSGEGESEVVEGVAVWCLPPDPPHQFIQGQLALPKLSPERGFPVLGTKLETEACLHCAEGGYEEFELRIYSPKSAVDGGGVDEVNSSEGDGTVRLVVERKGGSLMTLRAKRGASLSFDAGTVKAEEDALPYLHRYFSNVCGALSAEELLDTVVCLGTVRVLREVLDGLIPERN